MRVKHSRLVVDAVGRWRDRSRRAREPVGGTADMSQLLRNVAVVSTGALLVMATPDVAVAKTVSNETYATTYCDAIEGALKELNDVETEAQSASDPVAFRTGALATVDSVIASLQSAAANLQKLSPKDG